jgi:hypothetical protein
MRGQADLPVRGALHAMLYSRIELSSRGAAYYRCCKSSLGDMWKGSKKEANFERTCN